MQLIFDCTPLANWVGHPTGIQRVVIEVGKRLCESLPSGLLGLFDASGVCFQYDIERRQRGKPIELCQGDLLITAGSNWDYLDHHAQLLALRESGVKIITFFHDIIPMILPYTYGPGFSIVYEKWFREALISSDLAFANSENTRKDIINYASENHLKCPEIYAIRLGDEVPYSKEKPSQRILEKSSSPYILSVGTLEYRKNHILLLNAYRYMIDIQEYEPPKLLIVGKQGWLDHDIEYQVANDPQLTGYITILQGVTDADLQHLYQNTLFTVYPSHYEGWGLPIAESLCFGKPCIASDTSSMKEIAPGIVTHAHPMRLDEWVIAIRDFTDNPEKLKKATHAVQAGYKRIGWEVTASMMFDTLTNKYPELLEIKKTKIFFDCSTIFRWSGNATGIPRTVFSLAIAMRELHPEIIFVAIDDDRGCFHLVDGDLGDGKLGGVVNFSKGDALFSAGAGWAFANYHEQIRSAVACGAKFYQVFYDMIPTIFPHFYEQGVGFGEYFSRWSKEAFLLCEGAFAISACTKNDIISIFGLNEKQADRIKVIRLGEDFSNNDEELKEVTRFGKGGDFLISVGTLEKRKNQITLLNAYRLLAKTHGDKLPKLILIGRQGWKDGDLLSEINNDRELNGLIQIVSDANDVELQWLYKNCLFSLFPALYEGWGLPVAESLKAGRPCICSGVSSMLEIAPHLTVFASPHKVEDWAAAISYLLLNPDELEALAHKVKNEYHQTTWITTSYSIVNEILI